MRKLLAAAIVLAAGTAASADINHSLVQVDNGGILRAGYYACDLVITMSGADDWTSSAADATLVAPGATFYDHPSLDADGPQTAFWGVFPDLEYDSFYSGPGFVAPGFAGATVNDPTFKSATWFDTAVDEDVSFTAARYTIFSPDADPATDLLGTLSGASTTRNGGGNLNQFSFDIGVPAPGTAAIFGLAGLAGLRRRR